MALFSKSKRETTASSSDTTTTTTSSGGNFRSNIVSVSTESTALKVASVHRAVDVVANSIAQLTMEYQRKNMVTDCYVIDNGGPKGQNINYLLNVQPNRRMNAVVFWRNLIQQKIMRGNAYVYPRKEGDGNVYEFILLAPGSVTFDAMSDTYTIVDPYNGVYKKNCKSSDIIHIKNNYSFDGGLTGVSTLFYASRVLSIAATNDQQTLETSAKGGRVKLIIQQRQEASLGMGRYAASEMEKISKSLNDSIYTEDVSYFNGDGTITPISLNAQEQQLLENKKFSVAEISRYFGVPRTMLMDDSNSNYNTPEASTLEFMSRTLAPVIKDIQAEFNAKLLGPIFYGSHRYHFCPDSLFMLDRKSQAEYNKSRLETGTASVNELRHEMNMPRISAGDDYYVSCNIAPVGSAKINGEAIKEGGTQ